MAEYMTIDTALPPYVPFPRFLLGMDLTLIAKLIYAVLLNSATLSQANQWADESGKLFIMYPISAIADTVDRSQMTVKAALNDLESARLIQRERGGFGAPSRIYVRVPIGKKTVHMTDRKPSSIGTENCTSEGQKTLPMMDRKL